jgi:hypothetical protein
VMGLWVGLVSQDQKIAGFAGSYRGDSSALVLRWLVVRFREQAHSYRGMRCVSWVGGRWWFVLGLCRGRG